MYKAYKALGFSALLFPAVTLAASIRLTNGGFGQLAGNAANFGVAVCNGGSSAVTQSVPVTVSVNARSQTVFSAPAIKAGKCEYSYLSYSALGMQAGGAYSVNVTIDPQRTLVSNSDNQTTYSVVVPGGSGTAAANGATTATADVSAQSGNFFSMLLNWLGNLFK